ncbi:hypothetical protein BVRB_6g147310 [Beta vulgaris subsp. vulgaris]|nr:hypothetical protein BVRB_6g147310 [Beta vulgaris subsp. vulgaris]
MEGRALGRIPASSAGDDTELRRQSSKLRWRRKAAAAVARETEGSSNEVRG